MNVQKCEHNCRVQISSTSISIISVFFILDDAMSFIISITLSEQPHPERVRPGTPWYHARYPTPRNELNLTPSDNESYTTSTSHTEKFVHKERRPCC